MTDQQLDGYAALRRQLALDFVQRHTHENAVTLATPDASIRAKALEQMAERAANVDTAYDYLLQASMIKAVWAMETELRAIDAYPFG